VSKLNLSDLSCHSLAVKVSRHCGGKSELLSIYRDVCNHGADSGFNGFIYYYETVEFFRKAKNLIIEALAIDCDDLGISIIDMVSGFRCICNDWSSDEIGRALYGPYNSDLDVIYNALAWYALEKVCFEIDSHLN
jgi:hypothetical protein